jgi:hypothetical protein
MVSSTSLSPGGRVRCRLLGECDELTPLKGDEIVQFGEKPWSMAGEPAVGERSVTLPRESASRYTSTLVRQPSVVASSHGRKVHVSFGHIA